MHPFTPEELGKDFNLNTALRLGLIAQLLRAYTDYRGLCDSISYWSPAEARKTEDGIEIWPFSYF